MSDKARTPADYRVLRIRRGEGAPKPFIQTFLVEPEGSNRAPSVPVYRLYDEANFSRPPQQPNGAILYVSHDGSDAELRTEPLVRELAESHAEATWYACDVRGLGESRPNTCGDNSYAVKYGCDYFYAVHGIMLNRSYVAGRVEDVLRALDFVADARHEGIHLVAKGYGAIPACFAALLHPRVTQVTLKNALTSYAAIASAAVYDWPLSSFLPGALRQFDLPDVYRELTKTKKLRLIDPWGPDKKPV